MSIRIIPIVALLMAAAITGCKEEDTSFSSDFSLSSEDVVFDGNNLSLGCQHQTIAIKMEMETVEKWNAICALEDLWCSVERSGNKLLVTVTQNNIGEIRSTWIEFSIGDNIQRINVNQDYLRILSFADIGITVGAARHDEYLSLTTNIAIEMLSARISEPANCDWITGIAVNTTALTFHILRNPSTSETRTATITVTGDGASASIVVTQDFLSGYPYVIDISGADFADCYIYEIWDNTHNLQIGELCKEYLHKNNGTEVVRLQTVVAYPMINGKMDLSKGLVVENGFFVGWNPDVTYLTAPDNILETYAEGETVGAVPTIIYLDEGATRMSTYDIDAEPGDRIYATLKPCLLYDQRSGPANNQEETEETFTYKIVKVGTQYWMAENLRTSRFNDGENIPTGIVNADWDAFPGPGCVISSETGTRYQDVNAPGVAQDVRMAVGVLYNFYAIVRQQPPLEIVAMTNFHDMISPAGWNVPTNVQLEMLRNYTAQSSVANGIAIPELDYLATNETGFGIRGNGQRGATGGWNSNVTFLGSITYDFFPDASNNNHVKHDYYALRMDVANPPTSNFSVAGSGNSGTGNGFYAANAAHSLRCVRND